ncbi:MAG TPA: BTAD domain-containing putative transcriptional regulator, partial [Jiangellaceae bacterium]|nr:BTAD domain-containing putative transcriptional regulator [Jiangellaceae bacterium]
MEIRLLGPLEVVDGGRVVRLPAGRARALLALLALHAPDVVPTGRIIDELWGESPPATVAKALQNLVSMLRKSLEPYRQTGEPANLLRTTPVGYLLFVSPTAVDAHLFRRRYDEAHTVPAAHRADALHAALELWRGDALADFAYEPFAQRHIAALQELRMTALEERVEADLARGRAGELVAELGAVIAQHPFRERLRGCLMVALYRAGRQNDALEVFQETRRTLVEEFGIEPSARLRDLEAAILRQDPALDADVSPRVVDGESWFRQERRQVTVVMVGLGISSDDGHVLDPEAARRVVDRSLEAAVCVLRRHGASVEALAGDAVLGLFGFPKAHEDDPLRAVRAASEVCDAVREAGVADHHGLHERVSIGVESGEVVVGPAGGGHSTASGDVVNVAVALGRHAAAGDVLVGEATRRLVGGSVALTPVEQDDLVA